MWCCKCHDARFDVTTGKVLSAPALNDLPTYPVRIEGGDILLGPVEKAKFPKTEGTDPRTFLIVGRTGLRAMPRPRRCGGRDSPGGS